MVAATFFRADGDFLALHTQSAADVEVCMELARFSGRVGLLLQGGNGASARSLGLGYGYYRVAGVGERVMSINLFLSKFRIHGNIDAFPL